MKLTSKLQKHLFVLVYLIAAPLLYKLICTSVQIFLFTICLKLAKSCFNSLKIFVLDQISRSQMSFSMFCLCVCGGGRGSSILCRTGS